MTEQSINQGDISFSDKWENIGYHRVLGSFYWNIIFAILGALYALLIPVFIPYPESMGFYNVLTGIFSSIFTLADLGTASSLSRFIAEWRVKDPQRTIMYVRFFIWFQSFTGLVQTTVISLIGLYAIGGTNISYMPWLFLWLSTIQYPGWLSVFNEAMKGFQQYGKVSLVGVLNSIFFQSITLALGAQLGAYLGNQDPHVGGILGASIGMTIGYYVDDFSTVLISGWLFSKILKPLGFRIKDVFVPKIEKEIAVESIKFGIGVMLFVFSFQSVGTIVSFIYVAYLPNYSTYIGVLSVLSPIMGLSETVNGIHVGNHRSTVSEAYFNDKKNYAEYLLSNGFRTIGQITAMITPIVLVFGKEIVNLFFSNYISTFNSVFFYVIIYKTIFQHSHLMDQVLIGTGHHKFNITITIVEQLVSLMAVITCIYFQLGIFVLIIPGYFQTMVKQGIGWIYINKKIINLHFNPWQFWISTGISSFLYFLILKGLFVVLTPFIGNLYAALLLVLMGIYVFPGPFFYLPLALLGGYDKFTLEDFKNAVQLSGPSKIIVNPWYKFARLGALKSFLHGKFPMYHNNVDKEIRELMLMKKEVDSVRSTD
ncbi:MAG: hypothetical protein ACTSYS_11775 [Promethearchaeota archaeon]